MQVYTKGICFKTSILDALKYFHIFRFPLYFDEIYKYLNAAIDKRDLQHELNDLVASKEVFFYKDLYMLENDRSLADRRIISSKKAKLRMQEANRSGSIIARFPFVKAVCVSGSLSKGYADDESDIDFFIITKKNRLWICRSLLHAFKKATFVFNKQHSYCMNYFLDESRLCLEEQNIFTGTEVVTLIPVYDENIFHEFIACNNTWVEKFFPNFVNPQRVFHNKNGFFKRSLEVIMNLLFANFFDTLLMNATDSWWRHKWQRKNYPMEDYELAMKTRKYVSKNHPANYQKKVLKQLKLQFNS